MIVHDTVKQTCEPFFSQSARNRRNIRDENFKALVELIRGAFGNREFCSSEFAEIAALRPNNARIYLVRLYEIGVVFRRRTRCRFLYSLEKKWGEIKWRQKDKSAISDETRALIAKAAARRCCALYGPGVDYGAIKSAALVGAFKFAEVENRETERPEAWQTVVVRNRAFSEACLEAERQLSAAKRRARRFEPAWIGQRDKAIEEIEREKAAKTLVEQIKDVACELASQKERDVLNRLLDSPEPSVARNERKFVDAFVTKFCFEEFELSDAELAKLTDDKEDALVLTKSSKWLCDNLGKGASNWTGRKHGARKRVCAALVNECLDGERAVPFRELKNLRLLRLLEDAGF